METNTRPIPLVCDDGKTKYRILVPGRSPEHARQLAEAQGHNVLEIDASQWSPADDDGDGQHDYSALAMGLAAGGLLFVPLALVGLVLGAQSKNGGGAIRLALVAITFWLLVVVGMASGT